MNATGHPLWRRLTDRIGTLIERGAQHLPMSLEERSELEETGRDPNEVASDRQLRLKIRMLGKEGTGGYF